MIGWTVVLSNIKTVSEMLEYEIKVQNIGFLRNCLDTPHVNLCKGM